jgi:hypothetical protein
VVLVLAMGTGIAGNVGSFLASYSRSYRSIAWHRRDKTLPPATFVVDQ